MPPEVNIGPYRYSDPSVEKDRETCLSQMKKNGKESIAAKVASLSEDQFVRLQRACNGYTYGVTSLAFSALNEQEVVAWIEKMIDPIMTGMADLRKAMEKTLED